MDLALAGNAANGTTIAFIHDFNNNQTVETTGTNEVLATATVVEANRASRRSWGEEGANEKLPRPVSLFRVD